MTHTPDSPIDLQTARLAKDYHAQGELELMLVRKIASLQVTNESIDRTLGLLSPRPNVYRDRLDRFRLMKVQNESAVSAAIEDLKRLQTRQALAA
jgi:hypothetical protein